MAFASLVVVTLVVRRRDHSRSPQRCRRPGQL